MAISPFPRNGQLIGKRRLGSLDGWGSVEGRFLPLPSFVELPRMARPVNQVLWDRWRQRMARQREEKVVEKGVRTLELFSRMLSVLSRGESRGQAGFFAQPPRPSPRPRGLCGELAPPSALPASIALGSLLPRRRRPSPAKMAQKVAWNTRPPLCHNALAAKRTARTFFTNNAEFLSRARGFWPGTGRLRGEACKLLGRGVLGGLEAGQNGAGGRGELIAMSVGNLADQTVGTQQAELSRDLRRLPADVLG